MGIYLIYGYGKSGKSVEKILIKNSIEYKIYDEKIKVNGGNYIDILNKTTLKNVDKIILSPGIVLSKNSNKIINSLKIEVIGELEFAYQNITTNIISVTGTNGKTTTVTLINEILKNKFNSVVAGNIGVPLSEVVLNNENEKYDCVVVEASSFQLEYIKYYKSQINVLLNIADDHLDRYKTLNNYINAKMNLFKNNNSNSLNVLNYDDKFMLKEYRKIKGVKYYISLKNKVKGVFIDDSKIILNLTNNKKVFCDVSELDFPHLFLQDILVCILVCNLMGIDNNIILNTIKSFKLLKSRVEKVGVFNGVEYINDSKATNIHSTISCINSINTDIILLVGGKNKGSDFKKLIFNIPNNVKTIICFGECGDEIYKLCCKYLKINKYCYATLDEAINKAWLIGWSGSSVVLSPACASFDEFKNYSERGEFFANKIKRLGKVL